MDPLTFEGIITSGVGRYIELHVPGREEIVQAPGDWPKVLCKGSLNVRIVPEGYPPLFSECGHPNTVRSLDTKCFPCSFMIGHDEFGNNQLRPIPSTPKRGSAQVWRAVLKTNGYSIDCWVLRRFGSGLSDQLELLSEKHMRSEYGLEDGERATIVLQPE